MGGGGGECLRRLHSTGNDMDMHKTSFKREDTEIAVDRGAGLAAARSRTSYSHLRDLVEVLSEHPSGLRRWSVMRAMRSRREHAGLEVPQKFEDEVERAFRNKCVSDVPAGAPERPDPRALFYRPKERAGEVWAVYPERAEEWLKSGSDEPN
jgi:hypothetical protein